MKRLLISLFIATTGWSATYDPFLLETQLSLLPKIAVLEKNILSSNVKTPIKILIAYDRGDDDTAASCIKILMSKFNGRLNGRPINATALPFDKLDGTTSYHFIYALKASLSQLSKVHNAVGTSGAITALYDADKLADDGLLLSIRMERTPIILINAKALRNNRFSFPDSLLEIARMVQ
ncbi:MAG: hypothetical protein Q8M43_13125 [Sulfuricurvum sp.]|uniref:hypothetical protein n=1 Tax=Sulfuricurvum sp. TaxID=2025608 RepID=UPI00271EB023|nr:hypothetical protein [Sulfuricurvum sp.]MDO9056787.1 hypothetical protein [Sulfuricurvum sp.]MDP3292962.1 hypothetical protein [Sulfuricurvum sp.]